MRTAVKNPLSFQIFLKTLLEINRNFKILTRRGYDGKNLPLDIVLEYPDSFKVMLNMLPVDKIITFLKQESPENYWSLMKPNSLKVFLEALPDNAARTQTFQDILHQVAAHPESLKVILDA